MNTLSPVVLIVDDDPIFRALAMRALQTAGYTAFEAADGDIAVAILGNIHAQLVVTDIMMPNKDGLETIMHLKRVWPSTRIIATSGGMQKTDPNFILRMAKNLGADAVFPKPFRLAPFLELVAEVLAAPADPHP